MIVETLLRLYILSSIFVRHAWYLDVHKGNDEDIVEQLLHITHISFAGILYKPDDHSLS